MPRKPRKPKPKNDAFAAMLRSLSGLRDMNNKQVAARANIRYQTYCDYERGDSVPRVHDIVALCDLFEVSADYLLGHGQVLMDVTEFEQPTGGVPLFPIPSRVKVISAADAPEKYKTYTARLDELKRKAKTKGKAGKHEPEGG